MARSQMNLVRSADNDKRRRTQVSGKKHFVLLILGLTSVTLVAIISEMTVWSPGRPNAARQLFLPSHHRKQSRYANHSQHQHARHHRAFGEDSRIVGTASLSSPQSATTTTISKHRTNNTSFTSIRHNQKRADKDNRPIFFLHVGIPKTGTTFLQCTICKHYYTTSGSTTTNDSALLALGRIKQFFQQDNLVYLGTCPCGGNEQQSDRFVLHNHNAIFDHQITWNEQHELGPMPFFASSNSTNLKNQTGMIPQLADSFRTRILQHHARHTNAILIFEGLHKFDPAHVAALAAFLNPLFRVHVLVAYRRIFEWLPSKYNSVHKPNGPFGPMVDDAWPGTTVFVRQYGHFVNKTIHSTMPFALDYHNEGNNDTTTTTSSFGQLVRDIETWQRHPAQIVRDNYARYFSNVDVINLHDVPEPPPRSGTTINPYLHHLFCSVLSSSLPARHVCQAVRLGQIGGGTLSEEKYSNPSVSLDYFRLAEEAHRLGWIQPAHNMSRSKVARLVQEKMQNADKEQQQQPHYPLQCLSNTTLSRLLNLSLLTEAKMFGSKQAEKWRPGHEQAFEAYRSKNKYCWLDTAALLRHNNWIDFFKRLDRLSGMSKREKI